MVGGAQWGAGGFLIGETEGSEAGSGEMRTLVSWLGFSKDHPSEESAEQRDLVELSWLLFLGEAKCVCPFQFCRSTIMNHSLIIAIVPALVCAASLFGAKVSAATARTSHGNRDLT